LRDFVTGGLHQRFPGFDIYWTPCPLGENETSPESWGRSTSIHISDLFRDISMQVAFQPGKCDLQCFTSDSQTIGKEELTTYPISVSFPLLPVTTVYLLSSSRGPMSPFSTPYHLANSSNNRSQLRGLVNIERFILTFILQHCPFGKVPSQHGGGMMTLILPQIPVSWEDQRFVLYA
jgi:hypothetical protein